MTLDTSPKTHGEPSIEALASGLGTLGRYGDNYMVHAAEGETVVPREVLEANPGLKEDLFRQMTMMGIENPNRYVVGDQLNSINPITGQPEFFFKKIFRAIKKVVKKAAPIIVPMLGNMILPGIGGLIASGLYTKAQGGSWGDALKAAGMAYLGNVASSGIAGALSDTAMGTAMGITPGQTFGGNIMKGITAPFDAVSGLIQGGSASPFSQGIFGENTVPGMLKQYDPQYLEGAAPSGVFPKAPVKAVPRMKPIKLSTAPVKFQPINNAAIPSYKEMANLTGSEFLDALKESGNYQGSLAESLKLKYPSLRDSVIADLVQGRGAPGSPFKMPSYNVADQKFLRGATTDVGSDFLGKVPGDVTFNPDYGGRAFKITPADYGLQGKEALKASNYPGGAEVTINNKEYLVEAVRSKDGDVIKNVFKDKAPVNDRGMLGKYILGPIERTTTPFLGEKLAGKVSPYIAGAGALGLAAYAGGAFKEPPPPPPNASEKEMAAYRAYLAEYAANPNMSDDRHRELRAASGIIPKYTRSQVASIIGRDVSGMPSYRFAAAGGGEVMGPGTGTSDSIPARLSDGEFVMTARAVRNAGGGDRSLGAARMYDMMNRFEQGAA